MQLHQQIQAYKALNQWFLTPLGEYASKNMVRLLQPLHALFKGDLLLQLGHGGENPWLSALNYKQHILASPFVMGGCRQIECNLLQIPLARNSVDCVIAPLSLEPFGNSMHFIDEIDRVLKPMGYFILMGLNPWGLWAAALQLGLFNCYGHAKTKTRSAFHISRLMTQRGYLQIFLHYCCYIPPVKHQKNIRKFAFLDTASHLLWPIPAGLYLYVGQKNALIPPTWLSTLFQSWADVCKPSPQPATRSVS